MRQIGRRNAEFFTVRGVGHAIGKKDGAFFGASQLPGRLLDGVSRHAGLLRNFLRGVIGESALQPFDSRYPFGNGQPFGQQVLRHGIKDIHLQAGLGKKRFRMRQLGELPFFVGNDDQLRIAAASPPD